MGVKHVLIFLACVNSYAAYEEIINHINSINTTWKAGYNSVSSYVELLLNDKTISHNVPFKNIKWDGPIPEEFDSRTNWPECNFISRIRDQGACASGWAIAAASSFSDRYCIATKGSVSRPFSSNNVLACCDCGGCNGARTDQAWSFFQNNGIVTGGDYHSHSGCQPYQIEPCNHIMESFEILQPEKKLENCSTATKIETPKCSDVCLNKHYPVKFNKDLHKIKNMYRIENDPQKIQAEIMTKGPVQAGYIVNEDFLFYKSGVYKATSMHILGGHSVRIIGWGVDKTNNVTIPYWIVANSWNTNWGDKGYFKILRGTDESGIESQIIAGEPLVA